MRVAVLIIALVSSFAMAQKNYISGVQKVTFRSGPGKTNKIIRMLETNASVTLIESGEEWSKVKDSSGEEGYVLNRFLSKEVPYNLRYKWLKDKYDKLKDQKQNLEQNLGEVKTQLNETAKSLDSTKSQLDKTSSSFEELKSGSKEYLTLKQKYEKTQSALSSQSDKVAILKSKASTTKMLWMIAGGGIFFFGWLIGLISRKKKKFQSSLRL